MSHCHRIIDVGDNPSDHLPISLQLSIETTAAPDRPESVGRVPSLRWEKCSDAHKSAYKQRLSDLLQQSPSSITNCDTAHCESDDCLNSIQGEYDDITSIINQADRILPRHKPGVQKHWWTDELTHLRDQSIDIHRLWQTEGKPRSGSTNDERLRVRAAYRRAIKTAQRSPKQSCWNKLHSTFISKNTPEFWKSWKQLYSRKSLGLHSVVNGVTAKSDIADSFKNHFVNVSKPNNPLRVEQLDREFRHEYENATASHTNCTCSSYCASLECVLDATFKLKKGKSADDQGLYAEHFFEAPLPLFDRLTVLFNKMLLHGYVPKQFQRGTIVPIVKDRHGNQGDLNNYRGITIAPIISKLFEQVLQTIFQQFLTTSSYQFGFKKKSSTSHAIYCLKEAVNYYTSHGSNVYCSFLDASKAFDRLVHSGLFLKLLQRHIPMVFLNIIISWYSNLEGRVRWGDTLSDWFGIRAGVRQGGILSPIFYCLYVDDLVDILSALGIGCHLRDIFLSILLYADDMVLLAPSLNGLQKYSLMSKRLKICTLGKSTIQPTFASTAKTLSG